MPKGARIGAYLESLRQSGMTPEPVTEAGVESDTTIDNSCSSHGGDTLDRPGSSQAANFARNNSNGQMMRSNSSHGGFNSGGRGNRSSPVPRGPNNQPLRRALTSASGMPSTSGEPIHRGAVAPLAEFEFPPPPADMGGSGEVGVRPTPSPRNKRRGLSENKENLPDRLGFAPAPPVRESLPRPGSVGHNAGEGEEVQRSTFSRGQFTGVPKSPVSPSSECRTLESPAVGSLSSPGKIKNFIFYCYLYFNKNPHVFQDRQWMMAGWFTNPVTVLVGNQFDLLDLYQNRPTLQLLTKIQPKTSTWSRNFWMN